MLLSLVIRDCSQFIQHLSKFIFHIFIIFVGQALKLEEEDGRSSGSGSVISVICKYQVWWWWAKVANGMKTWRTDIRCWILIDLIERIEGEGESKLIWLLFCISVLLDLDFKVKKIVDKKKIRIGKKWLHLKSVRLHHWLSPLPPGTTLHQIRAKAPVERKNKNIKCGCRLKLCCHASGRL